MRTNLLHSLFIVVFFNLPCFYQSAEGCNGCFGDLGRRYGTGAGPQTPVRAGRGEGMWWGRVGAGGRRPAGTEVPAVASKSTGATPSEPWLLLLTTGRVDSTRHVTVSSVNVLLLSVSPLVRKNSKLLNPRYKFADYLWKM